jgi:carbon dioxide concentrating mechanism protein CcmM
VGVDAVQRQRVAEVIIQRPDGSTPAPSKHQHIATSHGASAVSTGGGVGGGDIATEVRNAVNQGYKLTVERASKRRFKTNSWLTIGAIDARNAQQAVNQINALIGQHGNEFIRLISINPQSKTRASQTIVHRPDGSATSRVSHGSSVAASNGFVGVGSSSLDGETTQQVHALLSQGYKIGTEHADTRRFKTKSWTSCSPIESTNPSDVIRALESCLQEHQGEYVRMIGIDTQARTRVYQGIIQRPGKGSVASNGHSATTTVAAPASHNFNNAYSSNGSSSLGAEVQDQVSGLLRQGFKIGIEYANKRRFKTKSWQTDAAINSSNQGEVIQALERSLNAHSGEYVRLVGIDPQAKKRVLETIIQRP